MLPTPIQNMANQPANSNSGVTQGRQQKGTGFTNIDNILNANEGAGQKIGQAIGSNLAGQADNVRAGIQQSQNQFNTDLNSSKGNATSAIQAGSQYAKQAGESDQDYANRVASGSNTDYTQIGKNLSQAAYNGPQNLSNSDQLNARATNVAALGNLAGTQSGQSQLLRSQVAQRGNYSQGQNALDSLLLGKSGQGAVQQGRSSAYGVDQQAQAAGVNAQNQASAAQSAIDTNRVNAIQALNNSLNGTGDTASNNILGINQAARNNADTFNTNANQLGSLLTGLTQGTIKPQDLKDTDKALLSHLSDYGINGDYTLYEKDPAALNSALANLGSSVVTNPGSLYYQGNQQQAAQNLAQLLGNQDDANSIKNTNKFNTNVFGDVSDLAQRAGIPATQAQDEALAARYRQEGQDIGSLQNLYNKMGVANSNANFGINTPNITKDDLSKLGLTESQLGWVQQAYDTGGTFNDPNNQNLGEIASFLARNAGDKYGQSAWYGYDQGGNSINGQGKGSNQLMDKAYFDKLALDTYAPTESVQNYVLNHLINGTTPSIPGVTS